MILIGLTLYSQKSWNFSVHGHQCSSKPAPSIPRFHDSTVPRCHDSTIPRFHDTTIPRYHGSTIQRFHDSTIQRFNDSTIQQFNDSTIQQFNNSTTMDLSDPKPRTDCKLKILPEDRQDEIAQYAQDHTHKDTALWLNESGLETSASAVQRFLSWYRLRQHIARSETAIREL